MSDTIRAMRAALLLAIGACASDPTLQVIVNHDPMYASVIDHTVVSVYETADLTCEQIEFGDVAADKLAGALVSEAGDGQPLSGLSRTGTKIIVARGFEKDGSLATAQCASKDEIVGNDSITITTVPAATLTVTPNMSDTRNALVITAADPLNQPIDGRQIYWRIYGAAGTSANPSLYSNLSDGVWEPMHPSCTSGGDAKIYPIPPKLPGGFGERLRVSWATEPFPLITTFTPFDTSKTVVSSGASVVAVPCAIQHHGTQSTIVCIDTPTANMGSTILNFSYSVAGGLASTSQALAAPGGLQPDEWIGVVAIDGTGTDRDVYAISTRGAWKALNGAPPENAGSTWCGLGNMRCTGPLLPPSPFAITALQVVPACGTKSGFLLARSSSDVATVRAIPLRGGTGTEVSTKDVEINNAGCVTELQSDGSSKLRQVLVTNAPPSSPVGNAGIVVRTAVAVFECSASVSPCSVPLPNNAGVTFYPGTEMQLVSSTFDATGATIDRWVMIPEGNKDRLVTRSRQVGASPPRQIITAQLDNDHQPDLFWNFLSRTDVEVQVAYAREAEGAPISALAPVLPITLAAISEPSAMFAADFNNDGYDEIVIVVDTVGVAGQSTNLVVVPTGVPYMNQFVDKTDDPCP